MKDYLTLLQNKELEILKFFSDFCEEKNIKYFISDGTLLGAVRHKGFIPWDDDIDVAMERKEYERFLAEFSQYIEGTKYYLEASEVDSNCVLNFAKIHDTSTTLVQSMVMEADNQQHVFLDVFPFDREPDSKFKSYPQWLKGRLLSFLLNVRAKISRESAKKFPLNVLYKTLELKYNQKSNEEIIAIRKKITTKYNKKNTKYYSSIVMGRPGTCLVPVENINKKKKLWFVNDYYSAPFDPDKYLSSTYGEYMELPPVEKRKNYHSLVYLQIDGVTFDEKYFKNYQSIEK